MKITIDQEDLEQIHELPFIQASEESIHEQMKRIPDNVRSQVFQLLQTVIRNLNDEYRLIKLSTIKEQENEETSK